MAPKSCKKPVYATMCETEDGIRTGKYRGNRYESHRKKTATKPTKTKAVRKTPATMKKEKAPKIVYDPDMAYDMAADRRLDDLEAQGFMVNRNRLNSGRKDSEELRLQTMHLQDAWMKRQASKRKKYGTTAKAAKPTKTVTMKTALKNLEDLFYQYYDDLYEGRMEESYDRVDAGDRLIKSRPRLVAAFNRMRKDFLSSDREVEAFYLALKKSKHRKLLYELDKKPKRRM